MDAVTAFLQGDLAEEIDMEQSDGYDDGSGRFGMAVCKPAATPSDPSQRLSVRMCNTDETIENVPYQEAVGSLLYLAQDWASDVDKRRSCTGYVFVMSGGAISWASDQQPTVELSTAEAEYMALSSTIQEAMWLKQLGQNLDSSFKANPTTITCDNQSEINLAQSDGYRARPKHIDIIDIIILENE
ncbi:hypothetical protein QE152_g35934 [Popillia japonica]|uniref:Polyprotein n=1 Tax=Popillia japonica TaxID=7064 RepID=A0AAW1IER6_POPJA